MPKLRILGHPLYVPKTESPRGPPNKHAEAFKRQKLAQDAPSSLGLTSPTQDAALGLASLSAPALLSAESICSISTLQILVDDYFTYIHPLIPLPHEPTFREAFARREDRTDRTFFLYWRQWSRFWLCPFHEDPDNFSHLRAQESNSRTLKL